MPNAWTYYSYSIATHAGQSINLAIICISVDKHYLLLDDIVCTYTTSVSAAPIANFFANQTSISVGGSVNFTDQSTNTPTSWLWNFGDGATSNVQNPTHVYSVSGSYNVSLTASNAAGSNTITKNNYITVSGNSQPIGTINSTIGNYFVSGVSPVFNTITASYPSAYYIDFYLYNSSYTLEYDSLIDNTGSNTSKSWSYDMGLLDVGKVIVAFFYDNAGHYLGYNSYSPNIIAKPQWLFSNGTVSNVNVVNNTVQMVGHFSFSSLSNSMPSDIPGLSGSPYNLINPEIKFNINFNCATGNATPNIPNINFDLNVFNQQVYSYIYPIPNYTTLSFDSNFNPHIVADGIYNTSQYELNWPLAKFYPLLPSPVPSVKIDGGLKINGTLKGRLVYDYNNTYSSWGIDTGRVTAKINAEATLRVKADALIASATGTLVARGSIGGGFLYRDFPSPAVTPLFGGALEIAGAIDYKLGPSFFTVSEGHLEKTFYQKTWGDHLKTSPFDKQIWDDVDALGNYTILVRSNPYLQTPHIFAQPSFSANDSLLYIVWLDTTSTNMNILLSKYNYSTTSFSPPIIVHSGEVISNPKVSILPSGNALIAWTQNRYDHNTFNSSSMNLTDLMQAQDIWVTKFDRQSNSVCSPIMLWDDNSSLQSGRAEGNANIIMGKGQYGLITWVVANDLTSENSSDVWYATIVESGNTVTLSNPAQLIDLTGTNKNINISYYDSTHAVACWINDLDGDENTLDNQVAWMGWTQTSNTDGVWGTPYLLISNDGTYSFDAVSLDFNGLYGAVACTAAKYDSSNGNFTKGIYTKAWDWQTQDWSQWSYAISPNKNYTQPKVSANKNGFVTLTYQSVDLFNDTLHPDVGQLNLYMNDSYNNPTYWQPNNANAFLNDPSVYDWDLNSSYGNQNNFYLITQEADTITGNAPINPQNGVRFGNQYLNLVLRAVDINGFVITDISEPSTHSTLTKSNSFNFNLYPNPFSSYTTIEYSAENPTKTTVEIYDLLGNKITTIFDGKQAAGTYKFILEPNGLSNGIYLCKVSINNQSAIRRMVIAK